MIKKQIAATLYGNSYMLQDKGSRILKINAVSDDHIICEVLISGKLFPVYIDYDKIGTEYHIVARPMNQLNESITHNGETFVPIVELAKIAFPLIEWKISNSNYAKGNNNGYWFEFDDGAFVCGDNDGRNTVFYVEKLFDKLREWNFSIGLPEGSWIPVTEQNNPYA